MASSGKSGISLPLFLLIAFVAAVVVIRTNRDESGLLAFSPAGAPPAQTFTVLFPTEPTKFVTRRKHPDGDFVTSEYQSRQEDLLVSVSVMPYPAPAMERAHKDPEKVLAGLKDWYTTSNRAKPWVVSNEEPFTTPEGYPGLTYEFSGANPSGTGDESGIGRFVIAEHCVFHQMAVSPHGAETKMAQQFLESLQLPKPGAANVTKSDTATNPASEDLSPEAPEAE